MFCSLLLLLFYWKIVYVMVTFKIRNIKFRYNTMLGKSCATDNWIHGNATECPCNVWNCWAYDCLLCMLRHPVSTLSVTVGPTHIQPRDKCVRKCANWNIQTQLSEGKEMNLWKLQGKVRKLVTIKTRTKWLHLEFCLTFINSVHVWRLKISACILSSQRQLAKEVH